MKQLLPQVPRYYKANLHCHTDISDGNPTPEEMKGFYKAKGYSILSITDHNIIADHSRLNDEDFLLLTGAEYNINQGVWAKERLWAKTYHLNFIAKRPDILWQPFIPEDAYQGSLPYLDLVTDGGFPRVYDLENINAMIAEANRRGFLVMYNHPGWSLQSYPDYAPLKGLWALEIANGDSAMVGFNDRDNSKVYTDLLNLGTRLFPVGGDDSHDANAVGGAWIMVGAEKLEYDAVIAALVKGDFYASTGPEIHGLSISDGKLNIHCTDARRITLESGTRYARAVYPTAPDATLCSACIDLTDWISRCRGDDPQEWIRVTVHGPDGDYATTRAYFVDELK